MCKRIFGGALLATGIAISTLGSCYIPYNVSRQAQLRREEIGKIDYEQRVTGRTLSVEEHNRRAAEIHERYDSIKMKTVLIGLGIVVGGVLIAAGGGSILEKTEKVLRPMLLLPPEL